MHWMARARGWPATAFSNGPCKLNVDGEFQSAQFADNENTVTESADGSTGQSYDDDNKGEYIGQRGAVYLRTSVAF
jgi:hypothetical protein